MFRWIRNVVGSAVETVGGWFSSLTSRVRSLFSRDDEEDEIREEEEEEEEEEDDEDDDDDNDEDEEEDDDNDEDDDEYDDDEGYLSSSLSDDDWNGGWQAVDELPPSSLRGPFPTAADAEAYAGEIPVYTRVIPRVDSDGSVVDWYVYVEGS